MKWQEIKALAEKHDIGIGAVRMFMKESFDPADTDQLLGVKAMSHIIGKTPPTVYKRIRQGDIKALKVKGVFKVTVGEVLSYLKRQDLNAGIKAIIEEAS